MGRYVRVGIYRVNMSGNKTIDLDWIDLVNKGKNPDIRLHFHLENNKKNRFRMLPF